MLVGSDVYIPCLMKDPIGWMKGDYILYMDSMTMYDDATYGEGTRNRGEEDKRRRIYDWLCTSVRISRCSFVTSSRNASGDDSRFKVVYTAMLGAEGSRREHAVITTSYPWRFTNREIQAQHKPIAIETLALNT